MRLDLYFIKVRARSKGTAEDIVGYFFGKTNNAPEYDFVVVPLRYSNMLDEITLEENLSDFKEKIEGVRSKLKEVTGVYDVTLAFLAYINNMMNRRGKIPLGIEFSTAISESDNEVIRIVVQNLFEEWSPKMDVVVRTQGMSLEEYSTLTFSTVYDSFGDENIKKIYSRPDIVELPEVFPVIDPINGTSIVQFDVEDKLPVVILDPGKFQKDIVNNIPDFDKNKSSVEATLISKEIVKIRDNTLFLIKVELFDGIIAKALISPSLKILSDETYFLKKKKRGASGKEREDGKTSIRVEVPSSTGSELLIAFITTILFTAALLIITYLFMK
jgi:predicted RNA-binding protein with EMAP domain